MGGIIKKVPFASSSSECAGSDPGPCYLMIHTDQSALRGDFWSCNDRAGLCTIKSGAPVQLRIGSHISTTARSGALGFVQMRTVISTLPARSRRRRQVYGGRNRALSKFVAHLPASSWMARGRLIKVRCVVYGKEQQMLDDPPYRGPTDAAESAARRLRSLITPQR
jgi:hypothetical protein